MNGRNWKHHAVIDTICDNTRISRRAVLLLNRLSIDEAARELIKQLPSATPEGAPYTFRSVRAALIELEVTL
jgi:hypothetical protein